MLVSTGIHNTAVSCSHPSASRMYCISGLSFCHPHQILLSLWHHLMVGPIHSNTIEYLDESRSKSWKRMFFSWNGTKLFTNRGWKVSITTKRDVQNQSQKFDTEGQVSSAESVLSSSLQPQQPTCSPNELTRLFHVLEDPQHFIACRKLHQEGGARAELEDRIDLCSVEFSRYLNSHDYLPEQSEPCDWVTQ